jgi:hypothetical protein
MGVYLKVISNLSPQVNAGYVSKRIIKLVSETQAKINNIKEFYDAFEGAQFYSSLELLGVAYFISTKMLMSGFSDKEKAKGILMSCFDKYVVYLSKYSDMEMSQEQFLHYVDARFANICNDFEMQNINVRSESQIVTRTTEKISSIYNKEFNMSLKTLIASLYRKITNSLSL